MLTKKKERLGYNKHCTKKSISKYLLLSYVLNAPILFSKCISENSQLFRNNRSRLIPLKQLNTTDKQELS